MSSDLIIKEKTITTNELLALKKAFGELVNKPNWLAGNNTKGSVPLDVRTGNYGSFNKTATWNTLSKVETYMATRPSFLPAIALSKDLGITIFDLDAVRDLNTGNLLPWARQLVTDLNSYTELSKSGTGLHIICFGLKPAKAACVLKYENKSHVEIYDTAKFNTLTGNVFEEHDTIETRQTEIDVFFAQHESQEQPILENVTCSPVMTDEEVLGLCRAAKNADKFSLLFDKGDLSKYNDDHSSADFALCCMFGFFTQDKVQIDRLFQKSALFRQDKWQDRTDRKYAFTTIDRAIKKVFEKNKTVYQPPQIEKILSQTPQTLLPENNPCKDFNIDDFPDSVKSYIASLQEITDAPLPMLVMATVATLSAYASKTYIPYFGRLYPNLYQLLLSKSGAFKSTAMEMGSHYAIEKESRLAQELKVGIISAGSLPDKERKTKVLEHLLTRAKASKLIATKTTAEMLFLDLSRGVKGLLALSEYGGWLGDMEKSYNKTLKAVFTDLYDCPTYYEIKTKGSDGEPPLVLNHPYITIAGFSSPKWLEDQIANSDILTGFFARYLLFYVAEKDTIPKPFPDLTKKPQKAFEKVLNNIEKTSGEFTLSKAAKDAYNQVYYAVYGLRDVWSENLDHINPFIKRWCPSILKVALLLQLADEPGNHEIQAKWIVAAARYISYAIASTLHILQSGILESEFMRNCKAIMTLIERRGGTVRRQQIFNSNLIKVGKSRSGTTTYEDVINYLIAANSISEDQTSQQKNNWTYSLNPTARKF